MRGNVGTAYTKGVERRALLMAKVREGGEVAAVRRLLVHVVNQQWREDWAIKRVEAMHVGESRTLGRFAPGRGNEHNIFVAVKAQDHETMMKQAIPTIHKALGRPQLKAHIMVHSMGVDF